MRLTINSWMHEDGQIGECRAESPDDKRYRVLGGWALLSTRTEEFGEKDYIPTGSVALYEIPEGSAVVSHEMLAKAWDATAGKWNFAHADSSGNFEDLCSALGIRKGRQ